jgi:hypothetical protein
MTERKPHWITFTSWIDQQITEAAERGAFDDLPGAGRPLPRRAASDDAQVWLREYLRREGVSPDVLLPTPLRLRKERELLAEAVHGLRSEQEVREAVAELNGRISRWRAVPVGPPIFVPLVDEDAMVTSWRDRHEVTPPEAADGRPDRAADAPERRRRRLLGRRARPRAGT